ncbi:hypothetical protein TNCV_2870601 [Trichonephila clavipes]|nr:hypothetical protein TNCV_2870601 [Trichonephila clavipes]
MRIRPSGIAVSDADCGAVGPGFENRRKHGSFESQSPLVRLVEVEERWVVFSGNWGGNEPKHTVTRMTLKAMANDSHQLGLRHAELCWPRSDLCRSGDNHINNPTAYIMHVIFL